MTLPNVVTPTYNLEIPSTKQIVKFRPFLVKEEKIILIAMQESGPSNLQSILNAIRQVVSNCTFGVIDTEKLTSYDLEFIFLNLKKKSSGAIVPLAFTCQNIIMPEGGRPDTHAGAKCGTVTEVKLDLETVKLTTPTNRSNKIMLDDTLGITLKDATLSEVAALEAGGFAADQIYETAYRLVDTVFRGETIYEAESPQEMRDFIDNLSSEQFQKIRDFFETVPTLIATIPVKCRKCSHEETVTLEGLRSFLV